MKTGLFALATVMALSAGAAAFAEEATGKISAIDTEHMTVTLDDGMIYELKRNDENRNRLGTVQVGDTLALDWVMSGDTRLVESFEVLS